MLVASWLLSLLESFSVQIYLQALFPSLSPCHLSLFLYLFLVVLPVAMLVTLPVLHLALLPLLCVVLMAL